MRTMIKKVDALKMTQLEIIEALFKEGSRNKRSLQEAFSKNAILALPTEAILPFSAGFRGYLWENHDYAVWTSDVNMEIKDPLLSKLEMLNL